MSGAAARQWDYSDSEINEPEKPVGSRLRTEYSLDPAYSSIFERGAQTAEAVYSYTYQETLRPRRPTRQTFFAPLWTALLVVPKGWWLITGLAGLLCLGLITLSLVTRSKVEVYRFAVEAVARPNAPVPAPNLQHLVQHAPTISSAKIDAVLQQYRSPAVGAGQAMFDLGKRYGIDPAYALAFFIHESSAGTQGVAASTRSIGNIRCTPGYDCYQTTGNGGFRRYSSWEAGIEDWYRLIKELYIDKWRLTTLSQIIPVYAPSADKNNPTLYIQQVVRLVESWQTK